MTAHFEDRHRALRDAITDRNRDLTEPYLHDFDQRTGPLVDGLVSAVRRSDRWGHADDCGILGPALATRACTCGLANLHAALTALDETAARA